MDIRNLSKIRVTTVAADITTSEGCTQVLAVAAKASITFKLATDRRLVNPQHFRNLDLLMSCFQQHLNLISLCLG